MPGGDGVEGWTVMGTDKQYIFGKRWEREYRKYLYNRDSK